MLFSVVYVAYWGNFSFPSYKGSSRENKVARAEKLRGEKLMVLEGRLFTGSVTMARDSKG